MVLVGAFMPPTIIGIIYVMKRRKAKQTQKIDS
jgi:hypothetical protein